MTKIVLLFDVMLLLIDSLTVDILRWFLRDFLIGQRNRKSARKIYEAQSPKDRFTLGFIRNHLTRYQKDFKIYHRIYMAELYSLIPQFIIAILCNILLWEKSIYVTGGFIVVKMLLNASIRVQMDGSKRSKYRRGK